MIYKCGQQIPHKNILPVRDKKDFLNCVWYWNTFVLLLMVPVIYAKSDPKITSE